MKRIYLILAAFVLNSCSKEDVGPMGFYHGQKIEVFLDHKYLAKGDEPLLWPSKRKLEYDLQGFMERQPGNYYVVKAEVNLNKGKPIMYDGSAYWLDFKGIKSKKKYTGQEPFQIELIQEVIPSGPQIYLRKEGDKYFFTSGIELTYNDNSMKDKFEEFLKHQVEMDEIAKTTNGTTQRFKWQDITLTVTHDNNNFGKAFKVSEISTKLW
jgi:hypothetical protein